MGEDLDKVAGQISPKQPTKEEIEDALRLQAKRQQATEVKMQAASKNLQELMKLKELQRAGWAIQFGYRLLQWAQHEASSVPGMDEMTLIMLVHAQERTAQETGCDFEKMVKDFKGNQLRWIEERFRENRAQQASRDQRIKRLKQKLRRQDIPLPYHSVRAIFGEKGFTHEDSLSLIGAAEGMNLVLRYIAIEYQRAGGTVLFLTENDKPEPQRVAKISMTGIQWINCCQIVSRLTETLDPLFKIAKKAPGLVIVESLDRALATSALDLPRQSRLQRAFALLKQYQKERGFALLVGLQTDKDPEGVDPMQVYPPLLLGYPFTQVRVEKSQLVDWSQNIVVGNDIMTLDELKKKVGGVSK